MSPAACIAVDGVALSVHHSDLTLMLYDFLRLRTTVKSVKWACGEGGCGACCVEVVSWDAKSGLGNSHTGFHGVQERLGGLHASQCGFCTPGFSVACHAALKRCEEHQQPPSAEVLRDALDGNLCRCTGYRPLTDLCKALSGCDIEDLGVNKLSSPLPPCKAGEQTIPEQLKKYLQEASTTQSTPMFETANGPLYVPSNMESLETLLSELQSSVSTPQPVRLVAGSTGRGVFKDWPASATIISLHKVAQLHELRAVDGQQLYIGAAVTLSELRKYITHADVANPQPWRELDAHLGRVAGTHVRNMASIGGNLVLARTKKLPSDVATLLAAAGARVNIRSATGKHLSLDIPTLLHSADPALDNLGTTSLLASISLPIPGAAERMWTSRVAHRYSNSKALINMAVWVKLGSDSGPSTQANVQIDGALRLTTPVNGAVQSHRIHLSNDDDADDVQNGASSALQVGAVRDGINGNGSDLNVSQRATGGEQNGVLPVGSNVVRDDAGCLQDAGSGPGDEELGGKVVDVRVVVGVETGTTERESWHCTRLEEVEKVLKGRGLGDIWKDMDIDGGSNVDVVAVAAAALEERLAPLLAVEQAGVELQDGQAEEGAEDDRGGVGEKKSSEKAKGARYVLLAAEGMLVQALSQLLGLEAAGKAGAAAGKMAKPLVPRGKQVYPEAKKEVAPVMQPEPKTGIFLQASGEAVYTADIPIDGHALFAAWVLSDVAAGEVESVDTTAAFQLPGVDRFISADDIPNKQADHFIAAMLSQAPLEPVFSKSVNYCGEGIGLVLATSPSVAEQAARLVKVAYKAPPPGSEPVFTLREAEARGPPLQARFLKPSQCLGDPAKVLAQARAGESNLRVVQGQYACCSQLPFYMEPQVAVATPDEGGRMVLLSSNQDLAGTQASVARLLNVQHNKVIVKCRRLGGGFGGKVSRALKQAAAVAVAAAACNRQVRLVPNRNVDMTMNGGRNETVAAYEVAFDEEGLLQALSLEVKQLAGFYLDNAWVEGLVVSTGLDVVYKLPHFSMEFKMFTANIAPHCTVRAPGKLQVQLIIENIIEHVAAVLGLSPEIVRERNFLQADATSTSIATVSSPILASQYTIPRIWEDLKTSCEFEERLAAVRAFNAANKWRKRGISMVPCRFHVYTPKFPAAVMLLGDGSVQVAHPGVEMGQGLMVKVLQVAAYELSKVLPEGSPPLSLDLLSSCDNSTEVLPHGGVTSASMASEGSCEAVRSACMKVVEQLRPFADKLEGNFTWCELLQSMAAYPGFMKGLVCAYGYGGVELSAEDARMPSYAVFGAGCTEVEIDVLTGDRRVLRSDLLFDCGDSVNPAVDIGQVEGAFVFGLGALLNEEVKYHHQTGKIITNSTWNYKVPGVTCIPQVFNVSLLKDSPRHTNGPLSAKAVGEPPLILASSILSALQHAVDAARAEVSPGGVAYQPLQAPATPQQIRLACGKWRARDLLNAKA